MKIATWNVNSVRSRLDHIINWLNNNPVDVLCLQETKVVDTDFPHGDLAALGYHVYIYGQKSYNGVALLSKKPLEQVSMGFASILTDLEPIWDEQKRVITGVIDGVRILNLYVPNGSEVGSEKYDYKLRWLTVLRKYLQTLLLTNPNICMCGDFNIALEDKDIYEKATNIRTHIMSSDTERQALKEILELGFTDAFRKFTTDGGHFSWWDYRAAGFSRNRGWRIDHHYLTKELCSSATSCIIDSAPRKLDKPSDHTPVIVEF